MKRQEIYLLVLAVALVTGLFVYLRKKKKVSSFMDYPKQYSIVDPVRGLSPGTEGFAGSPTDYTQPVNTSVPFYMPNFPNRSEIGLLDKRGTKYSMFWVFVIPFGRVTRYLAYYFPTDDDGNSELEHYDFEKVGGGANTFYQIKHVPSGQYIRYNGKGYGLTKDQSEIIQFRITPFTE